MPGRPVVLAMCVTHPLAASAVAAAAWTTGATAEGKDALKRNKYSRTGTGGCGSAPLRHETYDRAGPDLIDHYVLASDERGMLFLCVVPCVFIEKDDVDGLHTR